MERLCPPACKVEGLKPPLPPISVPLSTCIKAFERIAGLGL